MTFDLKQEKPNPRREMDTAWPVREPVSCTLQVAAHIHNDISETVERSNDGAGYRKRMNDRYENGNHLHEEMIAIGLGRIAWIRPV